MIILVQADEKILRQTQGTFRLRGKVTGTERDNYYRSGIVEKEGRNKGKEYRSLRFGIQTSPTQTVYVEMFGMEPTEVYVIDNNNRTNGKAKGEKVPYDEFLNKVDMWAEDGKICIESTVSLDEKGRNAKSSHMPNFDNIDVIFEKLNNGDSVYVTGDITRSSYVNQQGQTQNQTRYNVRSIQLEDDIDFDSPRFREYAKFKEEFIYIDSELDEDGNLIIDGRSVDYFENTYVSTYKVSALREDCLGDISVRRPSDDASKDEIQAYEDKVEEEINKKIEERKVMIKAFADVPYGSIVTIDGEIVNKVIVSEVADEEEDELLALMRGSSVQTVRSYISSMLVTGAIDMVRDAYTEDDFIKANEKNTLVEEVKDVKEEKEDSLLGALRGSSKQDDDPFGDSAYDIDDDLDSLPF